MQDPKTVAEISGTIILNDGSTSQFWIYPDAYDQTFMYQQGQATRERLGATVDTLQVIVDALNDADEDETGQLRLEDALDGTLV